MPIVPRHTLSDSRSSATERFTDRVDLVHAFEAAMNSKLTDQHKVLVYHGDGGIGKTALLNKLREVIHAEFPSAPLGCLDFAELALRQPERALMTLRHQLVAQGFRFPLFDIAYAIHWKKCNPETPYDPGDKRALIEGAGPYLELMGALLDAPLGGLGAIAWRVGQGVYRSVGDVGATRALPLLRELPEREAAEIRRLLPLVWARDLTSQLDTAGGKKPGAVPVLMFDTFEALTGRADSPLFRSGQEWFIDLVENLPQPLWVVFGRDNLWWDEFDSQWTGGFESHLVGGLSDEDAEHFLEISGVADSSLRSQIVMSAGGIPYYLQLQVDICEKHPSSATALGLTPISHTDVVKRWLSVLEPSETAALECLCLLDSWDEAIFAEAMRHFCTGYPATHVRAFGALSVVRRLGETDQWALHDKMQMHLREHLQSDNPSFWLRLNQWLHDRSVKAIGEGLTFADLRLHERHLLLAAPVAVAPEPRFLEVASLVHPRTEPAMLEAEIRVACQAAQDAWPDRHLLRAESLLTVFRRATGTQPHPLLLLTVDPWEAQIINKVVLRSLLDTVRDALKACEDTLLDVDYDCAEAWVLHLEGHYDACVRLLENRFQQCLGTYGWGERRTQWVALNLAAFTRDQDQERAILSMFLEYGELVGNPDMRVAGHIFLNRFFNRRMDFETAAEHQRKAFEVPGRPFGIPFWPPDGSIRSLLAAGDDSAAAAFLAACDAEEVSVSDEIRGLVLERTDPDGAVEYYQECVVDRCSDGPQPSRLFPQYAIWRLIEMGRLDDAAGICRQRLSRYPDAFDIGQTVETLETVLRQSGREAEATELAARYAPELMRYRSNVQAAATIVSMAMPRWQSVDEMLEEARKSQAPGASAPLLPGMPFIVR